MLALRNCCAVTGSMVSGGTSWVMFNPSAGRLVDRVMRNFSRSASSSVLRVGLTANTSRSGEPTGGNCKGPSAGRGLAAVVPAAGAVWVGVVWPVAGTGDGVEVGFAAPSAGLAVPVVVVSEEPLRRLKNSANVAGGGSSFTAAADESLRRSDLADLLSLESEFFADLSLLLAEPAFDPDEPLPEDDAVLGGLLDALPDALLDALDEADAFDEADPLGELEALDEAAFESDRLSSLLSRARSAAWRARSAARSAACCARSIACRARSLESSRSELRLPA